MCQHGGVDQRLEMKEVSISIDLLIQNTQSGQDIRTGRAPGTLIEGHACSV